MKVLVLSMGGTIDAAPYPEVGNPPYNITPSDEHLSMAALQDIADSFDPPILLSWLEICNKDSKNIDGGDLTLLEHTLRNSAAGFDRAIVTIGTDRMSDVAADLKARLGSTVECPVVFTGAIWPLANPVKSEGRENLKLALIGQPSADPGVYIAMHGLFAPCEHLYKDIEKRRFVHV